MDKKLFMHLKPLKEQVSKNAVWLKIQASDYKHFFVVGAKVNVTWRISEEQLVEVMNDAWSSLQPNSAQILANALCLPRIKYKSVDLPYQDSEGMSEV